MDRTTKAGLWYVARQEHTPYHRWGALMQIGARVFHFGAVGTGSDTKLAMNLMLANIMQSMAEGFSFAQKAELDMGTFVEAFKLNAGWSVLAEMKYD